MMNKIYRTTDIDRNCLLCKYCKVEDICWDFECEKHGCVLDYSMESEDFPICNDYIDKVT